MPKVDCIVCSTSVHRPPSWLKKTKQTFCSKKCYGLYRKGRRDYSRWTNECKSCGKRLLKRYLYCQMCRKLGKHKRFHSHIEDQPLQFYIDRCNDQNRYRSIRDHAKRVTKDRDKKCVICGYDLHIEICHIKSIKDFAPTDTVGMINHPDNLVLMCKNHHWELDHGHINLNRPTRTRTWN